MNLNSCLFRISNTKLAAILFSMIFVLNACNSSNSSQHANNKTDTALSESQKHLPKNTLKGLVVAPKIGSGNNANRTMLKNPTNIHVNEHGRVWVTEAYNTGLKLMVTNQSKRRSYHDSGRQ